MEIFTKLLNSYRFSKLGFLMKLPTLTSVIFCFSLSSISGFEAFGQAVSIWTNPITGTNPGAAATYNTGDINNANISVS